jgi:nitrogen regulatory protein PII
MKLSSINIDATEVLKHIDLKFSAVVAIVPKNKKEDAVYAAREGGATGVTHFSASGMGLGEMDNFYRIEHEINDEVLLFILPEQLVEPVLKNITHKLHLTTTGDGFVFAMPISHIKGISLKQQHLSKANPF